LGSRRTQNHGIAYVGLCVVADGGGVAEAGIRSSSGIDADSYVGASGRVVEECLVANGCVIRPRGVGMSVSAILITFGADSILDSIRRSGGECLNLREHVSGFVNSRFDVLL
jgi:hypothetical protein